MFKFKVDENLPTEAAGLLGSAGHDAVTVRDQHLLQVLEREPLAGKLWIVAETSVRVRS